MKTGSTALLSLSVSADSQLSSSGRGLATRKKISRKRSIAEAKSSSLPKRLHGSRPKRVSARSERSRKGWSPERRARQAALIRAWAPWQRSTGPKTAAGKAHCAMNALKHGYRSQAEIREYQRIRYVLRLAARNVEQVRLLIRLRNARLPRRSCYAAKAGPRIKYKFLPERAMGTNTAFPSPLVGEGNRLDRIQWPRCG